MKGKIINTLVLAYGLVVFIVVFGILVLAFQREFPARFGFPLWGWANFQRKLFLINLGLVRDAFPHGYIIYMAVFIGLLILGVITFYKKVLSGLIYRELINPLKQYIIEPFNKRKAQYIVITLTAFWFISLAIEEYSLRRIGIYDTVAERSGGNYASSYRPPRKGWVQRYPTNIHHQSRNFEFVRELTTNSFGFVDREWSVQKKDSLRIAMIGDSFTEGIGASQDSSYPRILERKFGGIAEVMNFGIAGYDPIAGKMLLEKIVLRYQPDIVTLTFNSSDIDDLIILGGEERFSDDGTIRYRPAPWWENLYGRSHISRLVMHEMLNISEESHLPKEKEDQKKTEAMGRLKKAMDAFQRICLNNKARCVFIFHPTEFEVWGNKMVCDPLMAHAKSKGYEYIDILTFFRKNDVQKNTRDYYWRVDSHNNSKGYELFARGIYEYLTSFHSRSGNSIGEH